MNRDSCFVDSVHTKTIIIIAPTVLEYTFTPEFQREATTWSKLIDLSRCCSISFDNKFAEGLLPQQSSYYGTSGVLYAYSKDLLFVGKMM